ncbi:unnamed protein product [Blepharisma stoltei]|uniref:Uncharacterized protein n=1 Tax=Blepharisma stoltei TaxID=1481888 RepID=A0AAU9JXF1_9CILI|nr:unnamed protein product [Blepharisma stoltei]
MGSSFTKTILCNCDKKANDEKKSEISHDKECQQQSFESTIKEEITEFDHSSGGVSPIERDFKGFLLDEANGNGFKESGFSFELGGKLNWIEKEIIKERYRRKNSRREQNYKTLPINNDITFIGRKKPRSPTNLEPIHIEMSLAELADKKNDQSLYKTSDFVEMRSHLRTPSLMHFSTLETPSMHHRSFSSNLSEKSINLVERIRSEASSSMNYNASYDISQM